MLSLKKFYYNFCFPFVFVFLVYLVLHKFSANHAEKKDDFENSKNHFIIYSVYYYEVSKLYSPNSMILLLNAHKDISPETVNLQCFSENRTSSLFSKAQIRLASYPGPECQWELFLANCSTISNPEYFALTTSKKETFVELNFVEPVMENYPVLMCYPPMVYESRWQQIIFATEIYRHFGADMQIQYVNSAMVEIVELLEIYQEKGIIKIEPFAFVDFDAETIAKIGMNPMLQLNSRNQPLALTDCLMKYRESSEFIIVADVDDVLFPRKKPFFNEFQYWSQIFPDSSALIYFRSYAKIDVEETFGKFSLEKTIKSLKKLEDLDYGKTVYLTAKSEAPWIHWPAFQNSSTATIPPSKGRMLHVQITESTLYMINLHRLKPFNPISDTDIQNMSLNFTTNFAKIPNFKADPIYAKSIFDCYQATVNWNATHPNEKVYCVNPLQCKKPDYVKNYKCQIARKDFLSKQLNKNTILHFSNSNFYWWKNDNGCKIFLN